MIRFKIMTCYSLSRRGLVVLQCLGLVFLSLLPVSLAHSRSNPNSVSASQKYQTYSVILCMDKHDGLEKRVLAAASPQGQLAGNYLTMAELADQYGRSQDEIDVIANHIELLGGRVTLIGKERLHLEVEFPDNWGSIQDTITGQDSETARFSIPSHQEMMRLRQEEKEENWHPSVIRSAKLAFGADLGEKITISQLTSMECKIAHALQKLADHPVDFVYKKPPSKKHTRAIHLQRSSEKAKTYYDVVLGEALIKQDGQAGALALTYHSPKHPFFPLYKLTNVSEQTVYDDLDINYYLIQYIPICPNGQMESLSNPCVARVELEQVHRYFLNTTSDVEQEIKLFNQTSLTSFAKQDCATFFEQRGGSALDACQKLNVSQDTYIYSFDILKDFGDLSGQVYSFTPIFLFTDGNSYQPQKIPHIYGDTATAANIKSMYSMPLGSNVAQGQRILLTLSPAISKYYLNFDDVAQNAHLSKTTNPQVDILSQSLWAADNMENDPNGEATLDVQTVGTLAEGARILFFPNGDAYNAIGQNQGSTAGTLMESDWLLGIMQLSPELPSVVSMSYGAYYSPADISLNWLNRNLLMLTSLGVTIVASSGDDGSCHGQSGNTVQPAYPAGSQWVLSVGGTMGPMNVGNRSTEVVCMVTFGGIITSAGGLSALPRPEWQKKHVDSYMDAIMGTPGAPNEDTANLYPNGRGYPDVAFAATKVPIVQNDEIRNTAGTSYSAPAWASIIAHLNTARNKAGLSNLGFANMFIYWAADNYPDAFNDIVDGSNGLGNPQDKDFLCDASYPAVVGWDAATGLGTPNVDVLTEAALSYGNPRIDDCINNSTHCTCFVEDFLTCAVPDVEAGKCNVKRCSGSVCGCDVPEEAKGLCVVQELDFYSFDEPVEFDSPPSACSLKTVQAVTPAWAV